jgi:hypothetical protein
MIHWLLDPDGVPSVDQLTPAVELSDLLLAELAARQLSETTGVVAPTRVYSSGY